MDSHNDNFPIDEDARVKALRALRILDTAPEESFDEIVADAARQYASSVALVSFVDSDRLWFKAAIGTRLPESPRDYGFCSHAVEMREPLVVADALDDPRFMQNALVTGETAIRSYIGVPILEPGGQPVGTVCVMDHRPHTAEPDLKPLRILASKATSLLRQRAAHTPRPTGDRVTGAEMQIAVNGRQLVARISGALVQPQAVDFADRVIARLPADCERVTVDLADCQHVDSGGVAVLVRVLKACKQSGAAFQVINPRPSVSALFKLLRLDRMMGLTENASHVA